MTNQVNLDLVWASGGGSTDPGDTKYQLGWISEIPTYQNFNFVLGSLDGNIKANAEKGNWDYEATITYQPGASVRTAAAGIVYYCHTATTGNEPTADTSNNYWSTTPIYGVAPTSSTAKRGFELKSVSKTITTWEGQDVTVANAIPLIAFETSSVSEDNWLLGNLAGDMVVVDAGTVASPDSRNIAANAYKIFHEGHLPLVSEVVGAVEEAPVDGFSYARVNSGWTKVTSTTVQATPPTVVGDGAGWYNTSDGHFYIDVNDGDTSQWVPASPPTIPVTEASLVTYDDSASGIGTDVQSGMEVLAQRANPNLLINGGFDVWQRSTFATNPTASNEYNSADRWRFRRGSQATGIQIERSTVLPDGSLYSANVRRISGDANTDQFFVTTQVESVDAIQAQGKTITLSFLCNLGTDFSASAVNIQINSGTGIDETANMANGTFLTGNNAIVDNTAIDVATKGEGVWQEATVSYAVPSNATEISLNFNWTPVGSATSDLDGIRFAQVKLEVGSVATPYQTRPIGEELALCQRYYQIKSIGETFRPGANVTLRWSVGFMTQMRDVPAVTLTMPTDNGGATTVNNNTVNSIELQFVTGGTGSYVKRGSAALDAEL